MSAVHSIYGNFSAITSSERDAIDWCQEMGLLKSKNCDLCNRECGVYLTPNREAEFLRCHFLSDKLITKALVHISDCQDFQLQKLSGLFSTM
ncbi:unnamed protein product [Blepharisma stoltei]|uniref:Uncharacterized protein n=1 Tax=Blepharisma stoltei TaxID=1481888 RepID=A0AAU9JYQ0_9CILI|nr:unnamed protein product [Blepharisma stoltei]